jgi:hypothetical protein
MLVHPREVFKPAIPEGSALITHNNVHEAARRDIVSLLAVRSAYMGISEGSIATRKPILLSRRDGRFLLRFADRQLDSSSYQLPPRFTRAERSVDPSGSVTSPLG